MNEYHPKFEINQNYITNEHGLCDAAETHWAIYLISAINQNEKLQVHTGETSNGTFKYLVKGENESISGFTFGAESLYIYEAQDPLLVGLIIIKEDDEKWTGRPAIEFDESLKLNHFYDPEINSRWKKIVTDYAQEKNIDPSEISLEQLIIATTLET